MMDVAARTLGFLIVRRVLGLAGLGPDADAKDVEIAVLRHPTGRVAPAGRPAPLHPG